MDSVAAANPQEISIFKIHKTSRWQRWIKMKIFSDDSNIYCKVNNAYKMYSIISIIWDWNGKLSNYLRNKRLFFYIGKVCSICFCCVLCDVYYWACLDVECFSFLCWSLDILVLYERSQYWHGKESPSMWISACFLMLCLLTDRFPQVLQIHSFPSL